MYSQYGKDRDARSDFEEDEMGLQRAEYDQHKHSTSREQESLKKGSPRHNSYGTD